MYLADGDTMLLFWNYFHLLLSIFGVFGRKVTQGYIYYFVLILGLLEVCLSATLKMTLLFWKG